MTSRLTTMASCGGCAAKVPPDLLARIVGQIGRAERHPDLLVGTETGDDAAVFRLRDDLAIVATTDFIPPVCDDPFLYGQVAAANAISDVYAMGGTPVTALLVCAFPEALTVEDAQQIVAGATAKAEEAGCPVVGGHTVRNPDLLFGLAVTGTIDPRSIVRNRGARPGDELVLTKPLGTGLAINAYRSDVIDAATVRPVLERMAALNRAASAIMRAAGAHAATDVTGFGLAGHALGMARASGVRLVLSAAALPVYPGVLALQERGVKTRATATNQSVYGPFVDGDGPADRKALLFDAQTAGGLLFAAEPARAEEAVRALRAQGSPDAAIIGEVAAGEPRLTLSL
jgi:selenide, water dikinase